MACYFGGRRRGHRLRNVRRLIEFLEKWMEVTREGNEVEKAKGSNTGNVGGNVGFDSGRPGNRDGAGGTGANSGGGRQLKWGP